MYVFNFSYDALLELIRNHETRRSYTKTYKKKQNKSKGSDTKHKRDSIWS